MRSILTDRKLWLLLVALIVLRIPNLNRPVSKHHEFNTAVILINAESWEQAGGGMQFSYTPLLNYQGRANRVLEKGWHIDPRGNHVYLSFGAGWYVLPYFLFKAAHLGFTPLNLQLLNILVNLSTAILLYILLFAATGKKQIAFAGTALFVFMPAPLWYCGIGYVTTAVMLPLVIGILYIWHVIEKNSGNVNFKYLTGLWLLGIALSYFDWLAVFLLASMAMWALFKARKNPEYAWVFVVALFSIIAGVFLVLFQFSNYLGWTQVLHYWQSRFADRSTDTSELSFSQMIILIIRNIITGFLPLLMLISFVWIKRKSIIQQHKMTWPVWAFAAIIPYNGIFLNWSAGHEFAWMAFGLFATIVISVYVLPHLTATALKKIPITIIVFSLVQYFIINLPGPVSWKGERYNESQKLGHWIRQNIDPALPVFINKDNDKILQYYSKRTFNTAQTALQAKSIAKLFGIDSCVWLEVKNGKVEQIVKFIPPNSR